ncbi:VWA domain-containing protein [Paenibacillus sp. LMG 31456]|uniref:VWA domain-containing protein n=2 Tax=Paenibacillus foliorum TaxID=2654974 RepID=A0A972GL72_9BACL|nr:VWA domain-containing protein [Paenibacillus foliorum]
MKCRKMICLFIISILFFGGLDLCAGVVNANDSHEFKEGDSLVNLLKDGDGKERIYKFTPGNKITATNTKLRLFINASEIDSSEYTVDYESYAITMRKAPDRGAEVSIKYLISPTFEWEEGKSGVAQIGNALSNGDGSTRVFKLTTNYSINSSKNVSLYIDGIKISASEFTFNYENNTVTILEKRRAPSAKSKIYFYFPKSAIIGTQSSSGETTANHPSTNNPPANSSSGGVVDSSPIKAVEPQFQVPSGASFPGNITIKSDGTFTANMNVTTMQPTYTSYLMVRNANGKVVRRIEINANNPSPFSLSKLGLPSGGYYFYLKTVNQSGSLAASIPQFVPINNEHPNIQVFIGGQKQAYEQPPVNLSGSVLVPLRAIFESLGAKVEWESSSQTVTATREGRTILLTIGSNIAYVNGAPITLNVAPQLINGNTMVPVRFVSEALGGIVKWDETSKSVVVFQNQPSIPTSAESEQAPIEEVVQVQSEPSSSSPILGKISKGITDSSDIVFVIDVTASMGGVIDYVKETVKSFADSVPSGSNFAIVAYRDINYVDLDNRDLEFFQFTNDKDLLKANLDTLVASGGGDLDESGLEAIHMAVNKLSESTNSKRIIFITDAPVHDKGTSQGMAGFFLEQIITELQTNNVIFDAIAPNSGLGYEQIIQLVEGNKGSLYDINDATTMLLN